MTDDTRKIVIEIGTSRVRAGFAEDDAARVNFPALVGRRKLRQVIIGPGGRKKILVGDEAKSNRASLVLNYPISRGIITDWDDMEMIWHHTFYYELRVDSSDTFVLLSEAPLNPKAQRERMVKLMFETFDVLGLYVCIDALLAMYNYGMMSGVVLDSGGGTTTSVPIYEGYIVRHAIQRLEVAGKDVTEYLMRLLNNRGYSFGTSAEREIIEELKINCCYISQDIEEEVEKPREFYRTSFELPDGRSVSVEDARFLAPEILFQPVLIGHEFPGTHEIVLESIDKCDVDIRSEMYNNILLSGGSTKFRGYVERLETELRSLAPNSAQIKVRAIPHRNHITWMGGSIMAEIFPDLWISKQEFQESGPAIFHEKILNASMKIDPPSTS